MESRVHWTVVLDFRCATAQTTDYGLSSIVIKRDPANHGENSRGEAREPCGRRVCNCTVRLPHLGSSFRDFLCEQVRIRGPPAYRKRTDRSGLAPPRLAGFTLRGASNPLAAVQAGVATG